MDFSLYNNNNSSSSSSNGNGTDMARTQDMYEDGYYYITGPFPAFPEVGSGDFRSYGNMPGVRCKTCAAAGKETWVIEGKNCPECGTAC